MTNTIIEDFAQLLMDSNPQYIFWKNKEGVYLGCNQKYADFCNLENTDIIIGTTDYDYMDEKEASICIAADKEVMSQGDALLNFEEYVTNAKGVARWYNINKVPLKNDLGEVVGVLGTMTDVTELKEKNSIIENQAEALKQKIEELELKNKELEEFAYISAHDLQEPLRNISNFSELLEQTKSYDSEFVNNIIVSSKRMSALLKALLKYAVVDQQKSKMLAVDLNGIVEKTLAILDGNFRDSKFTISYDQLPTIYGYPERLISLFQNLIANAIKYRAADRDCHISISVTERNEKTIILCVEDNGIGFDNKYNEKVLKIFQRLPTKKGVDGMGVGLAICAKIMKMHKGKISIESEKGTCTKVFLAFLNQEI